MAHLLMTRVGLLVGGAAAALGIVAAACNEPNSYVYSARVYEADRKCMDPYVLVDLVSGSGGAAACDPTCLVSGSTVYVSIVCPPYPDGIDSTGTAPVCKEAIAAFKRDDSCAADGGSTNPPDAAAVPDAPDDASGDGAAEAAEAGADDAQADGGPG